MERVESASKKSIQKKAAPGGATAKANTNGFERVFEKGTTRVQLHLLVEKSQVTTMLRADGAEKRTSLESDYEAFQAYVKLFQKQVKAGLVPMPLANLKRFADEMLAHKGLDLHLRDLLQALDMDERLQLVRSAIAQADKRGEVVDLEGWLGAGYPPHLLMLCPCAELLRHLLENLGDPDRAQQCSAQELEADAELATVVGNIAREPSNHQWVVQELERAGSTADADFKSWLQARLGKLRSQVKVQKALTSAPKTAVVTEERLLEAILADPTSDAPRLVWADWLLEQGNQWGEYVTLSCEEERTASTDALRKRLNAAKTTKRVAEFLSPIRAFIEDYSFMYGRGLLGSVTVSAKKLTLPGAARAINLRTPDGTLIIKGLKAEHIDALTRVPPCRFHSVEVTNPISDALVKALTRSPLLAHARDLAVNRTQIAAKDFSKQ